MPVLNRPLKEIFRRKLTYVFRLQARQQKKKLSDILMELCPELQEQKINPGKINRRVRLNWRMLYLLFDYFDKDVEIHLVEHRKK